MEIREMFSENTKGKHIPDVLSAIEDDFNYLAIEASELDVICESFGGMKYKILQRRDEYFICYGDEVVCYINLYEPMDYDVMLDKGLFVAYGHEEIVIFFADGDYKSISTR